eukprot:161892-Rhodomonas_salina.1
MSGYSTDGRKFLLPNYNTPKKQAEVPEENPGAKVKVATRKASESNGFFLTSVGIENTEPTPTKA